jgi:glycosyltransferase involved in cell wall biosynthesis
MVAASGSNASIGGRCDDDNEHQRTTVNINGMRIADCELRIVSYGSGHRVRFLAPSQLVTYVSDQFKFRNPQSAIRSSFTMIFLWANKRDWRHPGPIVNIGVRNAYHLAEAGFETHLCLGAGPDSETNEDLKTFYRLAPIPSLHIHRITRKGLVDLRRGRYKATTSRRIFAQVSQLVKRSLAEQSDPIIILTREPSLLPRLAWLRSRYGNRVRAFYEAHDYYAELFWKRAEGTKIKAGDIRQSWLERLFLPRIDGVIGITNEQTQLYARRFPKLACAYLPLGAELNAAEDHIDIEQRRAQRRLVYVGRLTQSKGLQSLLRSTSMLAAANIRLAFWGGNEAQGQKVKDIARKFGSDDCVETVSSRSPDALAVALATQASAGLIPLEDDYYNRNLTCPAKGLDYLAHGLPTIASDLPSTRGLLGSGGAAHYVAAGDPTGFAREATALLDNPKSYQAATSAALARAREVSWKSRVSKLVEFVEATL